MRRLTSLLLFVGSPLFGATLPITSSHVTYLGWFLASNDAVFNGGVEEMVIVPDCLGEDDPTPSDGYPGCILATDSDPETAGLMDIVPPTMTGTGQAVSVGSTFDIDGSVWPEPGDSGSYAHMTLYYEEGPPCYIRWAKFPHYASYPLGTEYVMGFSDCSISSPNPQGAWQLDQSAGTAYDYNKWLFNFHRIPSDIATDYFSGNEMAFGPGKGRGGVRDGSAGPSLAIRPWTWPTDGSVYGNLVPVMYSGNGIYPTWDNILNPYWTGYSNSTVESKADGWAGAWMIRITYGGDDYETYLTLGVRPAVASELYPVVDIDTAKPDESTALTTTDPANLTDPSGDWPLYKYCGGTTVADCSSGARNWPDITTQPIVKYGVEEYKTTSATQQQPSIADDCPSDDSDNCAQRTTGVYTRIPMDTGIVSTCSHGTGPSSLSFKSILYFQDLAELGDMYQGTSALAPDELMAYDELDVSHDPDNDGWEWSEACVQVERTHGATYDYDNNILYFSTPAYVSGSIRPLSGSTQRAIIMYQIDVTGAGTGTAGQTLMTGSETSGGTIQ